MKLKDFIEQETAKNPMKSLDIIRKLIELASIEQYLNAMYGVDLDITVLPAEKHEGRFYGKSVIESIK